MWRDAVEAFERLTSGVWCAATELERCDAARAGASRVGSATGRGSAAGDVPAVPPMRTFEAGFFLLLSVDLRLILPDLSCAPARSTRR